MAPTADGCEDPLGVGGPGEGSWVGVVLADVAVDGGLQVDDADEHAALEPASGEGWVLSGER